jgi:hypothetical protein
LFSNKWHPPSEKPAAFGVFYTISQANRNSGAKDYDRNMRAIRFVDALPRLGANQINPLLHQWSLKLVGEDFNGKSFIRDSSFSVRSPPCYFFSLCGKEPAMWGMDSFTSREAN